MVTDALVRERELAYKEMIDEPLWERLVSRLVQDEELERELAEKVMNEALGFLKLSAENPGQGFSPSPLVDLGWHTFILYTRPYADFCEKHAGRFIHHNPTDEVEGEDEHPSGAGIPGTLQFMVDHGYPVNVLLWVAKAKADCTEGWGERCEARCNDGPRE